MSTEAPPSRFCLARTHPPPLPSGVSAGGGRNASAPLGSFRRAGQPPSAPRAPAARSALPMSGVLAAAAGSRFEPPAASAPGGRSAPRDPSGTGLAGEGEAGPWRVAGAATRLRASRPAAESARSPAGIPEENPRRRAGCGALPEGRLLARRRVC